VLLRVTLAGLEEVVAPLGTGLTDEQAALLQRHTAHVILLYDSDDPGLRATFRAGDVLLRHKLRVSVATLPEGEDPDTWSRTKARQPSSRRSRTRWMCWRQDSDPGSQGLLWDLAW